MTAWGYNFYLRGLMVHSHEESKDQETVQKFEKPISSAIKLRRDVGFCMAQLAF